MPSCLICTELSTQLAQTDLNSLWGEHVQDLAYTSNCPERSGIPIGSTHSVALNFSRNSPDCQAALVGAKAPPGAPGLQGLPLGPALRRGKATSGGAPRPAPRLLASGGAKGNLWVTVRYIQVVSMAKFRSPFLVR